MLAGVSERSISFFFIFYINPMQRRGRPSAHARISIG